MNNLRDLPNRLTSNELVGLPSPVIAHRHRKQLHGIIAFSRSRPAFSSVTENFCLPAMCSASISLQTQKLTHCTEYHPSHPIHYPSPCLLRCVYSFDCAPAPASLFIATINIALYYICHPTMHLPTSFGLHVVPPKRHHSYASSLSGVCKAQSLFFIVCCRPHFKSSTVLLRPLRRAWLLPLLGPVRALCRKGDYSGLQ